MKLTSVELHPKNSSEAAVLSFRDPRRINPYNVRAIIGLDADDIVARTYGGSAPQNFHNLSLEKRDIIIRIELNPNFGLGGSYSDLRDDLYRLISSSRTGSLQVKFKNDAVVVATISGFVTKFEAPHFNKTPEVQITLNCSDPMLKSPDPVVVDVSAFLPSLAVIDDPISTAPHGMKFEMEILNAVPSLKITDPSDILWTFEVVPNGGFLAGDTIHVSSEHNDKYIYVERGVDTIHLASSITPGSIWPIIFPGENSFSFDNPTDLDWVALSYYPTYWGV